MKLGSQGCRRLVGSPGWRRHATVTGDCVAGMASVEHTPARARWPGVQRFEPVLWQFNKGMNGPKEGGWLMLVASREGDAFQLRIRAVSEGMQCDMRHFFMGEASG